MVRVWDNQILDLGPESFRLKNAFLESVTWLAITRWLIFPTFELGLLDLQK